MPFRANSKPKVDAFFTGGTAFDYGAFPVVIPPGLPSPPPKAVFYTARYTSTSLGYSFAGLNPAKRYKFRFWAAAGGSSTPGDRIWTINIGSSGQIANWDTGENGYQTASLREFLLPTGLTGITATFISKGTTVAILSAIELFETLPTITFCHKRPLSIKYLQKLRYFEPISGSDEVIEDAPQKREFALNTLYISGVKGDELRQFLYSQRRREPFLWINPDRHNEQLLVKLVGEYTENQMLGYGEFEFTLREV